MDTGRKLVTFTKREELIFTCINKLQMKKEHAAPFLTPGKRSSMVESRLPQLLGYIQMRILSPSGQCHTVQPEIFIFQVVLSDRFPLLGSAFRPPVCIGKSCTELTSAFSQSRNPAPAKHDIKTIPIIPKSLSSAQVSYPHHLHHHHQSNQSPMNIIPSAQPCHSQVDILSCYWMQSL